MTDNRPPFDASARPTFTVSGAAEATGKSRRTIARMLDADALPGATRDDSGAWCIPRDALLAAGLDLRSGMTPRASEDATDGRGGGPKADDADQLSKWRTRAEVAEAVAAERERMIEVQRQAIAALTSCLETRLSPTRPGIEQSRQQSL
jgi:hypothetical protein